MHHRLMERQALLWKLAPHSSPVSAQPTRNQRGEPPGPLDIGSSTRRIILAGIWLGSFLTTLNLTLVATLLHSISSEFGFSHQASWLGTAYLMATCTFTPLYGRLCSALGRRRAYHLALIFTTLGTLGCGLSTSMPQLIAFRFLSGIGAGGLQTTSSVIISDMYSMRDRSMTAGIGAVFSSLGMGLGGPFGGFLGDKLNWRWAFLVQLPLPIISFILTFHSLKYVTPEKGEDAWVALKQVDYTGSVLLLLATGSFLAFLSLHFNGNYDLRHPLVIVAVILSIVSIIMFIVVEMNVAAEPVLAPFLLRQKIPLLVGASNLLVAQCNFTVMYYFPLWLQSVQQLSVSETGLRLLPGAVAMSFGSLFAGLILKKTGKYKALNVIFGIFPSAAAVMIANLGIHSDEWMQAISIIPLGFGNAVVLQTTLIALLASIDPTHVAVGTGFAQLFRGIGQVSGVGSSSALFQYMLARELRQRITGSGAEEIVQSLRRSAKLIADLPPELQLAAREAYRNSLRAVFLFAAASTFLAFICRLPIPELPLHGAAKVQSLSETHTAAGESQLDRASPT